MPLGVLSGSPDIITHAKFCVNQLRDFSAAAPPKVTFPILIQTTLKTVKIDTAAGASGDVTFQTLPIHLIISAEFLSQFYLTETQ